VAFECASVSVVCGVPVGVPGCMGVCLAGRMRACVRGCVVQRAKGTGDGGREATMSSRRRKEEQQAIFFGLGRAGDDAGRVDGRIRCLKGSCWERGTGPAGN
jgi:hypothetical protein